MRRHTLWVAVLAVLMLPALASAQGFFDGANWVAYNDCVGPASGSAPNTTIWSGLLGGGGSFEAPSGELVKFADGTGTGVTATLVAANIAGSLGSMPNAGTDAAGIFSGILNLAESASYNSSSIPWSYDVTFTGLDPTKAYAFYTTANRDGSSYAGDGDGSRWSQFSIIGADAYANASSSGVTVVSQDVIKMNGGYNTVNGYVVGWSGITAADGSFRVLSQNVGTDGPGHPYKSYGLQGFALAQFDGSEPPAGQSDNSPEPATWLLLACTGIVGFARRRKQQA